MVQSLLDLLCSQLKNLLSQAGVMLLTSFGEKEDGEEEEEKAETDGESERKDFRGRHHVTIMLLDKLLEQRTPCLGQRCSVFLVLGGYRGRASGVLAPLVAPGFWPLCV